MQKGKSQLVYPKDVQEALFVRRPNRFIADCRLGGRTVRAHLPNPGRLRELLVPGRKLLLSAEDGRGERKTSWTVAGVLRNGDPVMLHTQYTNRAARWLLEEGLVAGLEDWSVLRSEIPHGRSRFDFLLGRKKKRLLVEVKSCTLFDGPVAMFPDAVTERGRRHVLELAGVARQGTPTCVLFVVQSPRARVFLPDYHTDPAFAEALYRSRDDILIKAAGVTWDSSLALAGRVRQLRLPWETYRREAGGGGGYLVVLRLRRRRRLAVGGLGSVLFDPGFYVYAGSGRRGLYARINRHRRGASKKHWHIDYLRHAAEWREGLPVQTADDIECSLAAAMAGLGGAGVPGFGSSDCGCPTHLFRFPRDPMADGTFVDTVLHFRMGRLFTGAGKEAQTAPGRKKR